MSIVPENILKKLGDTILTIYHYEKEPENIIPVFVVKKMNFSVFDSVKTDLENMKFIILTQDDIIKGNDIFPLKFLHMKTHTSLQRGVDFLSELTIKKNDLRNNLEFELRNKLIQLREAYLSFDGRMGFIQELLPVMLIIREGLLYLYDKTASPSYDELKIQLISIASSKIEIFDEIVNKKAIDNGSVAEFIQNINYYLEDLTKQVDNYQI